MITAMPSGIFLGATLSDHYGGYKGKALKNALTLCCILGAFAAIFSLLETITFGKKVFTVLMWFFLFTVAGIMPIGEGIIVSCVPKVASNSASALYCIFKNIVGISMAPVLSGFLMEMYKDKRDGMIMGYQLILSGSIIIVVFFLIAKAIAKRIIE